MKHDLLGLALAGGESRRLGQDKAMLTLRGNQTQLDYTLSMLDTFCSEVAISGREEQRTSRERGFGRIFIPDVSEVPGPMSGVIAGLTYETGRPVLAVAIDLPLVDASLVLRLISQRNPEKMATCFVAKDGRPEPLLTIYEAGALKGLKSDAAAGKFSLRCFLEKSDVEMLSVREPQLIASVNTLEDLERVREQLPRSPK